MDFTINPEPYRNVDPEDFVPSTMVEAVSFIVAKLKPEDLEFVRTHNSSEIHFGGGMSTRNNWSFWEKETPIKRDCVENYKIAHADDLSGLLYDWVWAHVRGEPFDPLAYCETFHKHWRDYEMSSLQAGGYNDDGTPKEE